MEIKFYESTQFRAKTFFIELGVETSIFIIFQGWHGRGYTPGKTAVSTCDNRNNECLTTQYCVKIVDPIQPSAHYVTYKSDCWFQTTVQTNSSITTTITNKGCYPWSDGGQPPKQ